MPDDGACPAAGRPKANRVPLIERAVERRPRQITARPARRARVAAIPAAGAYNILSGQVSRYAQQLEAFAGEFITILSRQLEEQV